MGGQFSLDPAGARPGSMADQDADSVHVRGGEVVGLTRLQAAMSDLGKAKASSMDVATLSIAGVGYPPAAVRSTTRNAVANASMRIAQIGTTGGLGVGAIYTCCDRWWGRHTGAAATLSQVAGPVQNTEFALKIQRNAASASVAAVQCGQAFESTDSIPFAGRTCVLTFNAMAGANFSGGVLYSIIDTGTGVNGSANNQSQGVWTGQVVTAKSHTIGIVDATYFQVFAVPEGVKQIGVQFRFVPTGVAGADDSVTISNVDFREGQTQTTFTPESIAVDLFACRRWYRQWVWQAGGVIVCDVQCIAAGVFVTAAMGSDVSDMRALPTVASSAFGNWQVTNAAYVPIALNGFGPVAVNNGGVIFAVGTVAAGLVAGNVGQLLSGAAVAAAVIADARL